MREREKREILRFDGLESEKHSSDRPFFDNCYVTNVALSRILTIANIIIINTIKH
jgi:hypothetical protein